jgi:hypothetical protein|tara:strand:- start:122 stop:496 length:375 start_codon:yes stop_codon:yes gene_type:complete
MKLSEDTPVSLPAKNLIAIVAGAVMAAWFGFGVIERLNSIETQLQLIEKDIEAANEFIAGVPKGEMVSPQIQELYMLTEFLAGDVEKLKEIIEDNVPNIEKNEMTIQFHEDRIIDIEDRKNGTH